MRARGAIPFLPLITSETSSFPLRSDIVLVINVNTLFMFEESQEKEENLILIIVPLFRREVTRQRFGAKQSPTSGLTRAE